MTTKQQVKQVRLCSNPSFHFLQTHTHRAPPHTSRDTINPTKKSRSVNYLAPLCPPPPPGMVKTGHFHKDRVDCILYALPEYVNVRGKCFLTSALLGFFSLARVFFLPVLLTPISTSISLYKLIILCIFVFVRCFPMDGQIDRLICCVCVELSYIQSRPTNQPPSPPLRIVQYTPPRFSLQHVPYFQKTTVSTQPPTNLLLPATHLH